MSHSLFITCVITAIYWYTIILDFIGWAYNAPISRRRASNDPVSSTPKRNDSRTPHGNSTAQTWTSGPVAGAVIVADFALPEEGERGTLEEGPSTTMDKLSVLANGNDTRSSSTPHGPARPLDLTFSKQSSLYGQFSLSYGAPIAKAPSQKFMKFWFWIQNPVSPTFMKMTVRHNKIPVLMRGAIIP